MPASSSVVPPSLARPQPARRRRRRPSPPGGAPPSRAFTSGSAATKFFARRAAPAGARSSPRRSLRLPALRAVSPPWARPAGSPHPVLQSPPRLTPPAAALIGGSGSLPTHAARRRAAPALRSPFAGASQDHTAACCVMPPASQLPGPSPAEVGISHVDPAVPQLGGNLQNRALRSARIISGVMRSWVGPPAALPCSASRDLSKAILCPCVAEAVRVAEACRPRLYL